ncbi:MAG: hypothetical protein JRC87_07490 [Deltaproteobacteria bacterium]|nr:hypothetical protein [Deltaproteobacteria bacterium]
MTNHLLENDIDLCASFMAGSLDVFQIFAATFAIPNLSSFSCLYSACLFGQCIILLFALAIGSGFGGSFIFAGLGGGMLSYDYFSWFSSP